MRAALSRLLTDAADLRGYFVAGMPSRDDFCDDHVADLYSLLEAEPQALCGRYAANKGTALWRLALALGSSLDGLPKGQGQLERGLATKLRLAAGRAAKAAILARVLVSHTRVLAR